MIHDKASIHAWSLDGPHGYAKDFTQVPFVGTKTFAVTFKAGKYKFYCPPHESQMFGRFTRPDARDRRPAAESGERPPVGRAAK